MSIILGIRVLLGWDLLEVLWYVKYWKWLASFLGPFKIECQENIALLALLAVLLICHRGLEYKISLENVWHELFH